MQKRPFAKNYQLKEKINRSAVGKNKVLFLTIKTVKMNCQLCQKEFDAYRQGKLPHDMMTKVESHLKTCKICAGVYRQQILAERIIKGEKELQPDPFLTTRVMAQIDKLDDEQYKSAPSFIKVLKPVLLSTSMAAAVAFGILIGNLPYSGSEREKIPVELTLIDDAAIESVDVFANE